MKLRFVLIILSIVCIGMWLLGNFEGSQAAEPATTMTQDLEVVSQIGGELTAVDTQSGYAYVAAGPRMQVYDVFEATNPVLVSETEAYTAVIRELAVADSYAYLGYDGSVLRVWDIIDPFAPLEIGDVTLHSPNLDFEGCYGDGVISQIEIQGSYAYVVVKVACFGLGQASSLHILDISNPLNPQEISHYVLDENTAQLSQFYISLMGNNVYVTHDWFLNVLDVNDPASPTLLVEHNLGINERIQDMTIIGTYAYMVTEHTFYIFDITSLLNPLMVGQYARSGEHIAVRGNHAYLLGDGFYILDISNKTSPQLIASNQILQPQNIAITEGYAFVVADSLYVFTTTNLPDPPEVVSFPLALPANDIYVTNNMAYAETQNGLNIVDVSQVDQPILLGTTNVCGEASELFVKGDIVYVGKENSLCILDVGQPTAPQLLHTFQFTPVQYPYSYVTAIAKRGNFLYLILQEESCGPGGCSYYNTLRILDISDPNTPLEIPMYNNPPGSFLSDLVIAGDYAYLGAGSGLRILSLANPTMPVEVGSLDMPNSITRITVSGNRGYINSWSSNRINIINLQNPHQPTLMGEIESFTYIRDMTAVANTLYVTDNYNFQVIDASLPTAPIVIGEYATDNFINQFHLVGNNAFLATEQCYACGSGIMLVLDTTQLISLSPTAKTKSVLQKAAEIISHDGYVYVQNANKVKILLSQPGAMPIQVGEYSANGRIYQMVLMGDYLYLSALYQGANEIHIVDITQPTQPILVSRTYVNPVEYMALAGQSMYLTDYSGLAIWDISDPNYPTEVGYYEPDNAYSTSFVMVIDTYAFVFIEDIDHSYRLDIVNVSDPTAPVHVGNMPLTDWTVVDAEVVNDIAYIVQPYSGLTILDVTTPAAPQLLGTFGPWEDTPHNIEIRGHVAYIAEDLRGVQLLDISDPTQIQAISLLELPYTISLATTDDAIYVASWDAGLLTLRPFQESTTSTETQFSSPSDDVSLQFGNNAGEAIQYQRWWQDEAVANLLGIDLRFEVNAITTTESLQQGSVYTITVDYDLANLGAVREETLTLYRRDGNQWLPETSSVLDMSEQTIIAAPEQRGQFAVLGETYRTYFPVVSHSHNKQGYRLQLSLEQSGNSLTDLSGYGHDGRCLIENCPASVPGISQMARHFDGMNDFIQLGNPPGLNLKGEITIAAWVKPEMTTGIQNIVAHGYATVPQGEVFLRIANGYYETGSWDGNNHFLTYPVPTEDIGQWVYLVSVYDGSAWRLYRNGLEVSSRSDDTGSVSVHGRWAIGANGAGTTRFFQGTIDEIAIYARALSSAEIEADYHKYDD